MTKHLFALASALAVTAASPAALADTITLSAHSGSSYTFDVNTPAGLLWFNAGNTIVLNGLSGVTGATLTSTAAAFGTATYTPNSVTYTVNQGIYDFSFTPIDIGLLTITTTASNLSNVTYVLRESCSTYTGTVQNTASPSTPTSTPTAATPEPCSLLLLSTGAAVTGLFRRRRRSASSAIDPHQITAGMASLTV